MNRTTFGPALKYAAYFCVSLALLRCRLRLEKPGRSASIFFRDASRQQWNTRSAITHKTSKQKAPYRSTPDDSAKIDVHALLHSNPRVHAQGDAQLFMPAQNLRVLDSDSHFKVPTTSAHAASARPRRKVHRVYDFAHGRSSISGLDALFPRAAASLAGVAPFFARRGSAPGSASAKVEFQEVGEILFP